MPEVPSPKESRQGAGGDYFSQGQKFAPPPPRITIRTMKKDLEALRAGGGTIGPSIPQQLPPQPSIPREAFLWQETPRPVEPTVPTPPILEVGPTPQPVVPTQPQPPPAPIAAEKKKTELPKWLVFAALGVGFVLAAGGLGYWLIYPRLAGRVPTPPSPIVLPTPTPSPSPSPSPTNPVISLIVAPTSTETIKLFEKSQAALRVLLPQISQREQPINTFAVLAPQLPDGTYLSSQEIAEFLISSTSPSFISSLDQQYLIYLYFAKPVEPHLGLIFTLFPQTIESMKSLFLSWEEANIEENFASLFLGRTTGSRKTSSFQSVTSAGVIIREMSYKTTGISFDYAFLNNWLIVSTNRDSVISAIKHLTGE